MYDVRMRCRAGTWSLVDGGWQDDYHDITWTTEDTLVAAWAVATDLMNGSPREVQGVWVNER